MNNDRKLAQLCAQVEEVIRFALGESIDPRLQTLNVESVAPAPDASRLLVRCVAPPGSKLEDLEALYEALQHARPWLRRQVAAEIRRKRTPELSFAVLPGWEPDE
jgi:ribosome-binding factor A